MKINSSVTKAITETKYLSVDNHARYRLIMRLFYINYNRINYWLNAEDVYNELRENISGYTLDDCKNDLDSLVEWGSLISDHDTERIFTISDFKNKRFRYQMSEYAVEIERLTVKLENMRVDGASLDTGLLGTIRTQIEEMRSVADGSNDALHTWWRSLNENFKRLNREYQDYMKCFSFFESEDNSSAKQFIARKDDIIKYLRSFVKGIQKNGTAVAELLDDCEDIKNAVLERVIDCEFSIPRINSTVSRGEIAENVYALYSNLRSWFGSDENSEMDRIMNITNGIIRNITNYASILAESTGTMSSRKDEYRLFAEMFMDCESAEDAHRLSSLLFGLTNTCHITSDRERETESISSGIYDEPPEEIVIKPRVLTYREKQQQSAIADKSEAKKRSYDEYIKSIEKRRSIIESLIRNGRIVMEELPVIDPQTRSVLLSWISRATGHDGSFRTEYGTEFRLIYPENDRHFVLSCEDGKLTMPAFILDFGGTQ